MREHTRTRKRASARARERERGGEKIMTTHLDIPLEAVLFRTAVTQPLIEIRFEKVCAVGRWARIDAAVIIVPVVDRVRPKAGDILVRAVEHARVAWVILRPCPRRPRVRAPCRRSKSNHRELHYR